MQWGEKKNLKSESKAAETDEQGLCPSTKNVIKYLKIHIVLTYKVQEFIQVFLWNNECVEHVRRNAINQNRLHSQKRVQWHKRIHVAEPTNEHLPNQTTNLGFDATC